MASILLKTLPFFTLIGLGFLAGRCRFFSHETTAALTKFVFYFALSAMLFKFAANLQLSEVWNPQLIFGYLCGTGAVYGLATLVALVRNRGIAEAAVEAQCAAIGNVGFLGIPMLSLLLGAPAVGIVMMVLAVDLIVFSSLIVILITGSREGCLRLSVLRTITLGLIRNPMIVAMVAGLLWARAGWSIPAPMDDFLTLLSGAATPGALFAIGASLATKSAERVIVAGWLSLCKLVIHPLLVAAGLIFLFPVDPYTAAVAIAAASLPVAGNVYMLAEHYGVAPQRVSASILVSTAASVLTVSLIISWVQPWTI